MAPSPLLKRLGLALLPLLLPQAAAESEPFDFKGHHEAQKAAAAEAAGAAAMAEEGGAVLVLTPDNFEHTLKSNDRVLVKFYAPWCGHCKKMAPAYKEAAEKLKKDNYKTVLAKIDGDKYKEFIEPYQIGGFPTMKYFVKGKPPTEFQGAGDSDAIKDWVAKREVPNIKVLEGEEAEEYLREAEEFAAGVPTLPEGCKPGTFRLVAKVVKKSARENALHALVLNSLVDWEEGHVQVNTIYLPKSADPKGPETSLVFWRPHFEEPDSKMVTFTGKWTDAAMLKWLKTAMYPTVGRSLNLMLYHPQTVETNGMDGIVVVAMDDTVQEEDDTFTKAMDELVPLAQKETKWYFTLVPMKGLEQQEQMVLFGHSGTTPPKKPNASTVIVLKGTKRYELPEPGAEALLKPGAIKAFLQSVKNKKARPTYKSAPEPAEPVDANGVTTVVGSTFDKIVLDSKKDVLVKFYAPWCGHCKKLAPVWEQLGRRVKAQGWDKSGVVVATFDHTENDCDEEITGYPKIMLYPAVSSEKKMRERKIYDGARDVQPMLEWLEEVAVNLEDEDARQLAKAKGKKSGRSIVERDLERKKQKDASKGKKEL